MDNLGNVYTTGEFWGMTDFDPGTGEYNIPNQGNNSNDIFISKLDADGNFVWAKGMGGPDFDQPYSLTLDEDGNVYTTGIFKQTVDFDPGIGVYNLTSAGNYNTYISKLNTNGEFVWAKSLNCAATDEGTNIFLDENGSVYTIGYFSGTIDLDPGPLTSNFTSNGSFDIFIVKLDENGNYVWGKTIGGAGREEAYGLSVDHYGNIYTTGYFSNTVDFDPNAGVYNLTASGSIDIFLFKLNVNGDFVWAKQMSGTMRGIGISVVTNASGEVYTIGKFSGTVDFDPGAGVHHITSAGDNDIFIMKLSAGIVCMPTAQTLTQTACGSYTLNGQTYTSGGTYTQTLTNAAGCDSTVTLHLTVKQPSTATDVKTACGSYTWINGVTYTTNNNTATHVLTNAAGCDSTVTLHLTVKQPSTATDVKAACGSYTWINGVTYTTNNNTATHVLTNAAGCDSTITLNLTITIIDNTVTQNGHTMTANASGVSYQWMDCVRDIFMIGATSQNFTPTVNGSYAVIISKDGCSDTSTCTTIGSVGITDNAATATWEIYPNPTEGKINITGFPNNTILTIFDSFGKTVYVKEIQGNQTETMDLGTYAPGIYYIRATTGQTSSTKKIIRK